MVNQSRTPEFNLNIVQNASYKLQLTLKDSTGAVRDLTGYTGAAIARESYDSNIDSVTFTVAVVEPTNGRVDIDLTATETAVLDFGRETHIYDLMIKTGSTVEKVLQGSVNLERSVTSI